MAEAEGTTTARPWRPLLLFFAANVLFGAGLFAHAFLYNFYLDGLGFSEGVMGLAAAALTAGGLVALAPAGVAIDRIGGRAGYLAATALGAVGLMVGAVATAPAPIYAAAFVAGAGTATWRVSMGPLVMRLTTQRIRARAFSWNVALLVGSGAFWTAASGAIPGWVESAFGFGAVAGIRVVLALGAAATGASALLFLLIGRAPVAREPGPGPGDGPAGPERGESGGGSRARGQNGGRGPSSEGVADRLRELAASLWIPASLVVLVLLVVVWMTASGLVIPFFNIFFLRVHDLEVSRIGVILALSQALSAVVVFGSGELASRLGPRRTLAAWMVLFAPVLWGLALADAVPVAIGLFLFQGLIPPATNPLIDQILLERAPSGRQGAVSSWRNAATELSGFLGASAGGFLLEVGSFAALFALSGAIGLVGALGLLLALRVYSGAEGSEPPSAIRPRKSR